VSNSTDLVGVRAAWTGLGCRQAPLGRIHTERGLIRVPPKLCRMKIQRRLDALQPDGNEGTVTVESGQGEGGSGGAVADGEELELKNLCEDVVCSQLLKRVVLLEGGHLLLSRRRL
jgi:hypothetical protein